MLNVTVLAIGGLKERYFTEACDEYKKRLGAFCKLNVVEIDEFKLAQNPSDAEVEKCILSEGKAILAKMPQKAFVVALCIEGKSLSSVELAKKIEKIADNNSHIVFVVGGSHGLSREVKNLAGLELTMSAMTFPHQLARVMLLEQIYRAFSINGGLKYHK